MLVNRAQDGHLSMVAYLAYTRRTAVMLVLVRLHLAMTLLRGIHRASYPLVNRGRQGMGHIRYGLVLHTVCTARLCRHTARLLAGIWTFRRWLGHVLTGRLTVLLPDSPTHRLCKARVRQGLLRHNHVVIPGHDTTSVLGVMAGEAGRQGEPKRSFGTRCARSGYCRSTLCCSTAD